MRIGMLVPSIGNFGKKGFYNTQEIGLAKAMGAVCEKIIVYRAVPENEAECVEKIEGCPNAEYHLISTMKIGSNGMVKTDKLDTSLDALIFFSDTQLCVPKIYEWAKKNNILVFPYIGVLESHSTNKFAKFINNVISKRNIKYYQKSTCFTKTPAVKDALVKSGVPNVIVAPVGVDEDCLKTDYQNKSDSLRKKWGYHREEKVLLFIGRFTEEKHPEKMISIFQMLWNCNSNYRLVMVGTGELKKSIQDQVERSTYAKAVKFIEKIPNNDIWELYCMADVFVNLNSQEIFGMAILEAMYYGIKVVAVHAPGPDFIIEHGVSGYLANSQQEIIEMIENDSSLSVAAHNRILDKFTWKTTAETMVLSMKEYVL